MRPHPAPWPTHPTPLLLALALLAACSGQAEPDDAVLLVQDRGEALLTDAELVLGADRLAVDEQGRVAVPLTEGPVLGVIEADGFLPEPVIVGLHDAGTERTVSLWSADTHWALHAGGDVMLGRRYLSPPDDEPLLDGSDPGPGARDVVSDLAPAFAAADLGLVNLESVVGTLPQDQAYPGKRFLLQTPPGALDALTALSVDAVGFSNNHTYDWLDAGVTSSLDALDAAGLPTYGGGLTAEQAEAPLVLEVGDVTVGLIGFTSVDGSFVNDRYPTDPDPVPDALDPDEAWQYEARTWGFSSDDWTAPELPRRAGSAWRVFDAAEDELSPQVAAQAWASLRSVYPELQDWVARRGHGGAAAWRGEASRQAIAELDARVDVVVVQIHGGFQFLPRLSGFVDTMSRDSVEAGADLIIGHHPHVLQGASFHDDALVVHSLGNLIFDQDFLATFPTAMLRTVWEGDTLVEARLLPAELVGYRPVPVADAAARRTLRTLAERSRPGGLGQRVDGQVRVVSEDLAEGSVPASLVMEGHTARLVPDALVSETVEIEVPAGGFAELPDDGLIDPRLEGEAEGLWLGRDGLGWGRFADGLANARPDGATQWVLDSPDERLLALSDGSMALELERDGFDEELVSTRPVARIPLFDHRLWSSDGRTPRDPEARYVVRLRARGSGAGEPELRLTLYDFVDTDPTRDPTTTIVAEPSIPLEVGRRWREVVVEVEPEWVRNDLGRANQILPLLRLGPPRVGRALLQVASFEVVELREAAELPDEPGAWDLLHNPTDTARTVVVRVWRADPS